MHDLGLRGCSTRRCEPPRPRDQPPASTSRHLNLRSGRPKIEAAVLAGVHDLGLRRTHGRATGPERRPGSVVVIQRELVRMRAEAERVDLVIAFIVDPGADQIIREDATFEKEARGPPRALEGLVERPGRLAGARLSSSPSSRRCRGRAVPRIDLVLDAIEHRHQHRRPGQIAVAARIRAAELEPLRFRALRVHRDADRR